MVGLTVMDLVRTSSPIPLPLTPDLSQTHDQVIAQTVTAPTADGSTLIQPEVGQLADHHNRLLRERQEQELDLALTLRKPRPEDRRPDTRTER